MSVTAKTNILVLPRPDDEDFLVDMAPVFQQEQFSNYQLVSVEQARTGAEPQALVVFWGTTGEEVKAALDEFPAIRWVQLPSAGIERFRPALLAHPEKTWTTAKGAFAKPVGEHALALVLALLRLLPDRVRATEWGPQGGRSLHGLSVVLTGAGGVSQEILRLLKAFDTHVTVVRRREEALAGADRTVAQEKFREVLPDAEVLILGSALTEATTGMLGEAELAVMKPDAVVVNIGRGKLVDTEALTQALQSGRLAGAGLDVTDPEPLPAGHPLWDLEQVIITPHTADTREMIRAPMQRRLADNLLAFARGEGFVGVADPHQGY